MHPTATSLMPVPAVDAQSLEKEHSSAGEPLKNRIKELQRGGQLHWGSKLNASMQMQPAWGINKRSQRCVHTLQGYDVIGMTETWCGGACDWSVGMEGYRLSRKDRKGR